MGGNNSPDQFNGTGSPDSGPSAGPSRSSAGLPLPFGRVVKPHGLKGWLKVKPYRPDSDGLLRVRTVVLTTGDQSHRIPVRSARADRLGFLLALEGCGTREQAEQWRGAEVALPRQELEPLSKDEYYVEDCVGLEAFDSKGQSLGVVTQVEGTRAHDILVIRDSSRELLVPMAHGFVLEVDLDRQRIVLDLPEGLPESPIQEPLN